MTDKEKPEVWTFEESDEYEPQGPRAPPVDDPKAEVEHIEGDAKLAEALFKPRGKSGENPILHGIPEEDLINQVDRFAQKYGLEDECELLQKGALVARNPLAFESLNALEEEEIEALRFERDHKWKSITPALALTIIIGCLGAVVQGADQVASSGANLSFPTEFGIPNNDPKSSGYRENNLLVGLVNSGPYISATVLSWTADPLNHYFGRKVTLALAAIFCTISPIGSAVTQSWVQLFVTRLLLGIGVGIKEATAPVLATENAPTAIRGALTVSWNAFVGFGMAYGASANLAFMRVPKIAWRLQMGSAMLPALILLVMCPLVPESPRWLVKKGKMRQAWRSLLRLRRHPILAARDLVYMHTMLTAEEALIGNASLQKRFTELFTKNRLRQATLAATILMIARQMCGINIMSFYSSSIFKDTGVSEASALWASWGFAVINCLFAIPAVPLVDRIGRRPLLTWTFPFMFLSLLAAGLGALARNKKTRLGVMATFIYIFDMLYSPGEGPVAFIYAPEAFPLSHRTLGLIFSVSVNNAFAFVLSVTYFLMQASLTVTGAFGLYAGFNILAFVSIFLFVPETKGRSLEDLDAVFAVPIKDIVRYHLKTELPTTFRRVFLRDKSAILEPMI